MKRLRRVSTFLVIIIALGIVTVSSWVYFRYIKGDPVPSVSFVVERGDLIETISARGEVVSEREIDLAFLESGLVETVYIEEGESVLPGDALMKLDTREHELDASRLAAILAQHEAALEKLVAGATPEAITIAETKVTNADIVVQNARKSLVTELKEAYTAADDAVRNKIDPLFTNPRSTNPQLTIPVNDTQLKLDLESNRALIEYALVAWAEEFAILSVSNDLDAAYESAAARLDTIRTFLNTMAFAVNNLVASASLTQATIDTWKANVAAARTGVETAVATAIAADDARAVAEASLALAKNELASVVAATRPEDIAAAEAKVRETESSLLTIREKIRKATIYAPIAARIIEVYFDHGEAYTLGKSAISLSATAVKIQADISELEIGKVNDAGGNRVHIEFDAFSDGRFRGTLVNVEPKEVVKDNDKYYRVNVYLDETGRAVRPGMSADLDIEIGTKMGIVKIQEFIIYRKDGKRFVKVQHGEELVETEVEIGVSDGEYIEIVDGLLPGQTIVATAD